MRVRLALAAAAAAVSTLAIGAAQANLLNEQRETLAGAAPRPTAENLAATFQSPFASVPPLVRPTGASCVVSVFENEKQVGSLGKQGVEG